METGAHGYILFVRGYEDGGFWGFLKPYGAKGRRNNIFYTNKNVSPLVEGLLKQRLAEGHGRTAERLDVFFTSQDTKSGPRAVEVWLD